MAASSSRVWVGKKRARGVTGSTNPTIAGVKNIDVTSGSTNLIAAGLSAKSFSPMLLGPVNEREIFGTGELVAQNFENYWQYGKMFPELSHIDPNGFPTPVWYTFRSKGYAKTKGDRHPDGTKTQDVLFVDAAGKNRYRYAVASSSMYMNWIMDYVTSRKYIYCKGYAWLVRRTPAFISLKKQVDAGLSVQILDFDVIEGSHLVTREFLHEQVNDPTKPFGHGYVIAGLLAGLEPEDYC